MKVKSPPAVKHSGAPRMCVKRVPCPPLPPATPPLSPAPLSPPPQLRSRPYRSRAFFLSSRETMGFHCRTTVFHFIAAQLYFNRLVT